MLIGRIKKSDKILAAFRNRKAAFDVAIELLKVVPLQSSTVFGRA